jgi:hypothetical protein
MIAVRRCTSRSRTRWRRLKIKLVLGLDGDKAHVLSRHRLGDRLRIEEIVLVRLQVRLYELGRDESHVVSLAAQGCADEVCSRAGFDANQRALQVRGVSQQLFARKLLPDDYLALLPDCNQVKCCLAEIDANRSDVHVMILLYMLLTEIILRSG